MTSQSGTDPFKLDRFVDAQWQSIGSVMRRHSQLASGRLRRGNCTRHRWRNPLPESPLMEFIPVGGQRG